MRRQRCEISHSSWTVPCKCKRHSHHKAELICRQQANRMTHTAKNPDVMDKRLGVNHIENDIVTVFPPTPTNGASRLAAHELDRPSG
jgi:hypothetical protein